MALDPVVWGPHYWFVLHTIALTYPSNPNETIKKKLLDLVVLKKNIMILCIIFLYFYPFL